MEKPNKELFYAGTFTEFMYVMELDTAEKEITVLNKMKVADRPAFLCITGDKKYMYVANEYSDGIGGVSAYDLADKYHPKHINTVNSIGCGPAHVSLASADGKNYLLAAEFFDGRVCVYPINNNGSLSESSCTIQLYGSGPFVNHPRKYGQDHARAHYIAQVPGTRYVLCTDLGTDKVYVYRLENDKLTEKGFCRIYPGSGPRHIVLDSAGETVYLINELSSMIIVLDFDKEKGLLQPRQYISALPEGYKEESWCSAIYLSRDEKLLYCSNRGHNSIGVLTVEDNGKSLSKRGYLTEMVDWPRDMQIDPTGRYMLVTNQGKNTISLNYMNSKTGIPEYIGKTVQIQLPTCIRFY